MLEDDIAQTISFLLKVYSVNVKKSTVPAEYIFEQFVREYTSKNNVYENIWATTTCARSYGQKQCLREYTRSRNVYDNIRPTTMCQRMYEK